MNFSEAELLSDSGRDQLDMVVHEHLPVLGGRPLGPGEHAGGGHEPVAHGVEVGIRVNAVCPGWVRTRAAMRSLAEVSAREGRSVDAMLDDILSAQALPGLMEPADLASLYLFLASDARDITGQAVNVDRGEVMA
jgi:Enoyl-(Acyl carrier protein) reductase